MQYVGDDRTEGGQYYVRTVVTTGNTTFWTAALCSVAEIYNSEGMYCPCVSILWAKKI